MSEVGLTIIGGGIAGLSLGVALRRAGVATTLIEATRYPRHRVCGEFISGVSDATLEQLGVLDLLGDAEACRETTWLDGDGLVFRASLPESARGISRHRLDQRMAERFRSLGGTLVEGERYRDLDSPGEGVVLAMGRPRDGSSSWLGLKAHLLDFDLESDLEMHLGDRGYIGLSRVEEGRVNACALFQQRPEVKVSGREAMVAYLGACGLGELAARIGAAGCDPASVIGVSAFQFGMQAPPAAGGVVRLGDQFSIIGPFTGHGMSMAFQSSERVLPVLIAYAGGECSWAEAAAESERRLRRLFSKRMGIAQLVHPILTSPRGRRVVAGLARRNWLPFSLLFRGLR